MTYLINCREQESDLRLIWDQGTIDLALYLNTLPKPYYEPCIGHDEFTMMPFGLINGPRPLWILWIEFQTLSRQVVVVYIKDVLKYSKDKDDHTVHLRTVLQTLREHQLHSKYKKYEYWFEVMVFWNIWYQRKGLRLIYKRVKAVIKCPTSTNALRLETFWV